MPSNGRVINLEIRLDFICADETLFIVTAVSNSANLTDGMDGLATGSTAITLIVTLSILSAMCGVM